MRLFFYICFLNLIPLFGHCQNFEISSNVCDSLSPNDFLIHVSGYASFTDSMTLNVELRSSDSLSTLIQSNLKDFSLNGISTITNFQYNSTNEAFSLDIGSFTTHHFVVRLWSEINGEITEEILIDTF